MLQNMSQAEKDALLAKLLEKEAAEQRRAKAQELGLGWSKNGFVTVRQGKAEDKSLPTLYIHPSFIGKLAGLMETIEAFAQDKDI